jgi:heat shock protein HslJ/uncharacterized lipoprotein YbaY
VTDCTFGPDPAKDTMNRTTGFAHAATLLAAALLLVGCESPPTHPQLEPSKQQRVEGPLIRGELTYRQRIALPPDSIAVVELRDSAGNGPVVAEWRRTLGGQQVPIRFEMPYDPQKLKAGERYAVRGAIFAGGQPAWASDAKPVTPGGGNVEAGTLLLAPYQPLAFASVLKCGDRIATFGVGKRDGRDVPQLVVGDRRYDLREVVAASGARYEAIDDPRTTMWNKGTRATLVVGGEAWPECEMQRAGGTPAAATVRARGNEPFWSVEIDQTLRFRTPDRTVEGPAPAARLQDGVRRYEGTLDGRSISVALREQRCSDTMTGMPHPLSAEVQFDGRTYRGCGGNPADLLLGREWVVEDITGGMVDRSRATLNFAADGNLSGRASCNTFTTTYKLSGEGLAIGKTAATMMACAPSLMQQEGRFLDILQNARRFEITDTGALMLVTADDRRITARRPK